ncbi:MAG: PD-(D/E)XK nuclease family protein [Candidatus Pacebacteria bacterium]|nr:PD-(D/E)XK nuclease family protein [Candidatus Paceibacterota bacterium]
MSGYYKKSNNLFNPESKASFKLSRSKIDLFIQCPQCFYLDRRLGIGRPPGFPFNLNSAVDTLLKKEFDIYRNQKSPHPLIEEFGIDAIPYKHKDIDIWRNTFKGIEYLHEPTNLLITGAIDDIWVNSNDEVIIVDYKATSKSSEVNIDAEWQIGYKRQMEIYQWLFKNNGFNVSNTGYFVYCNGNTDNPVFDKKLEFDIKVIPYTGDTSWIDGKLFEIKECLMSDKIPDPNPDCDYCNYRKNAVIAKIKHDKIKKED